MSPTSLKLCVYCGSSSGTDPQFRSAAQRLGQSIAANSCELVYGGGHVGLMGAVADSVLAAGGRVRGVITEQLLALEVAHQGLTSLDVEPTMHARKARMAELADGIIVLPGGYGTLEETFEILTWNQLGLTAAPVVFLNVDGFFDPLFEFIGRIVEQGFMKRHHGNLAQHATDADEAVHLASSPAPSYIPKWVD